MSKFAPDLPPIAPGENPAWSIRSERQLATKYPACMAEGRAETAGLEIKENRMKAHDVMTRSVVSVQPHQSTQDAAKMLRDKGISAVPVIDANGVLAGMVSEGDLIGREDWEREARRDWWLTLLADGEELSPVFLATLKKPSFKVQDVMTTPVITVDENLDIKEIARKLIEHRIKRVPVVREGRVVGIVSRADLVEALARQ